MSTRGVSAEVRRVRFHDVVGAKGLRMRVDCKTGSKKSEPLQETRMKRLIPWALVLVLVAVLIWVLPQSLLRERDTERASGSGTWWEPASLRDDEGPVEQPVESRAGHDLYQRIALAFESGVVAFPGLVVARGVTMLL